MQYLLVRFGQSIDQYTRLVAYTTRSSSISQQPKTFSAVLNSIVLMKCLTANLWENSPYVSKQLKGIGPAFSMLLASAGKTNFLLLEESHPRDLERIMNKGPPAGNIIRKQVSLLPKYQLTATPIDRDRVNIQLTLLNHAYLSENLEHFTAGDNHKSFIIAGDSENYLLYLTCFKDTDLINIYDGCITFEITRKHNYGHKVVAYCISSSIVGIDVQVEYSFIEIGPIYRKNYDNANLCNDIIETSEIAKPKSTDRKRKGNKDKNVTCSKVKIKRDNALLNSFKCLKECFVKTSKEITENVNKNSQMLNNKFQNLREPVVWRNTEHNLDTIIIDSPPKQDTFEHIEDEYQVNTILTKIENEIDKAVSKPQQIRQRSSPTDLNQREISKYNILANQTRKAVKKHDKSNFYFIDVLEKEMNSNEENEVTFSKDNTGFTDTVKCQIDKYLQNVEVIKICNDLTRYKEVLQVENEVENNIKKDNTIFSHVLSNDLSIDSSQTQGLNCVKECVSCTVNEKAFIGDIEESTKEHLQVLTHNNSMLKDDGESTVESNENDRLNSRNLPLTFFQDNTSDSTVIPLPLSMVINNEINENNKSQNCSSKDILIVNNTGNSEETNNNLHIFNENEHDNKLNDNKINKKQDTTNRKYIKKTDDMHSTNSSEPIAKILQPLKFNDTSNETSTEINDNVQEPKDLSIVQSSSSVPIIANNRNLWICSECCTIDYKPFLKSSIENKSSFLLHTNIAGCSHLKSVNLDYNSNNIYTDHPVNKREGTTHTERYSFTTTKSNMFTESESKNTIKIISKLKIDLDITKIVSTKGGNTSDPVINDPEKNILYENKINMPEKSFNSNKNKNFLGTLRNNFQNDSNNVHIHDNSKDSILQTSKTQEPILNQVRARTVNTIEDVLKKYSLKMRKPKTFEEPVKTQVIDNNITKTPSTEKTIRRYKISDLLDFQTSVTKKLTNTDIRVQLNNTIAEKNPYESSHNYLTSDSSLSSDISNDLADICTPVTPFLQSEFSYELEHDCNKSPDILKAISKTPKLENESFNLNTLLNPKTLLQCYRNNNVVTGCEQVIPPPPEFADDIKSIPLQFSTNAYTPSSPDYDPEIDYNEILKQNFRCGTKTALNILDVYSSVDEGLSPSEDKTRENDIHERQTLVNINPKENNYTVKQNRSPEIRTLFLNNRNIKLGKFKYQRKNLLKLRKMS